MNILTQLFMVGLINLNEMGNKQEKKLKKIGEQ